MKQVPTQFIENCKQIGVDKKTAMAYYANKTSGKPTTGVISHLVGTKFKSQAEANSKLLSVYKQVVDVIVNTCRPVPVTSAAELDCVSEARQLIENAIGKFKSPKPLAKQVKKNKIVIASDFHVPFHSLTALEQLVNCDAETLIIAGDFADMFSANRFNNDTSWISMKEELASLRAIAEYLSANFKNIYYITGNHDDSRVNKRINEVLPHLAISYNLIAIVTAGLENFKPLSYEVKGTKPHTRFGENETLNQFGIFGDIAICHFDNFTGQDAAIKANTFLDQWSHILKLPNPLKVILHGHTHRLNLNYTPQGKVLISTGCMSQPQGYQLQQAGKYTPPTVGFITLEQTNGVTDVNSIRTVFIG